MVLAELNAFVSRPIAPTRRIAMGDSRLPCSPAPGMGGLLLGAIVATFAPFLDDESRVDLLDLMSEIERGNRIPQPRLRHRYQTDNIGLQGISYQLVSSGEAIEFHFPSDKATPLQHILVAIYAAKTVGSQYLSTVMRTLRRSMTFPGGSDLDLIRYLTGSSRSQIPAFSDPVTWALEILELVDDDVPVIGTDRSVAGRSAQELAELPPALPKLPSRVEIQRAFRSQLRYAHPDHGAERIGAAQRIADLAEARRILLDH